MRKRFSKLTKTKQEEIELEYHQTNPPEFDEQMSKAKKHVAEAIRLPREMVETLKVMAESEGERGYQTMVRKWIEQRMHQEARK